MTDSGSSRSGPPPASVTGEVQSFDPGPSVAAAASVLETLGADFALIFGLALEAWGIPRATKDADFAVPVGAAERAADALRGPTTEVRPMRIGGVGLRDIDRGLRIDLVDRRFHFSALFRDAIREAQSSGRKARVANTATRARSSSATWEWPARTASMHWLGKRAGPKSCVVGSIATGKSRSDLDRER
jgi:hypothetical protein